MVSYLYINKITELCKCTVLLLLCRILPIGGSMKEKLIPLLDRKTRLYRYNFQQKDEILLFTARRTGYLEMKSGYYLEREKYNSYCLSVTAEGTGKLTYGGKDYTLHKNSVMFFDQNEKHVLRNLSQKNWCHYYVYFWGSQAADFYTMFLKKFGNVTDAFDPSLIVENILKIHEQLSLPLADETQISLLLYEIMMFLYQLCRSGNAQQAPFPVLQAETYLRENFKKRITLQDVADFTNVSKFYLSHMYKAVWGIPIIRHLILIRFEHCMDLLKETDLTISEILSENNFTDKHAFIAMCKESTGLTPSAFRQKYRKKD